MPRRHLTEHRFVELFFPSLVVFMKAWQDAAIELGIPRKQAIEMIRQTFIGSAKIICSVDATMDDLLGRVASAGGTTEAALKVLDDANFQNHIGESIKECLK